MTDECNISVRLHPNSLTCKHINTTNGNVNGGSDMSIVRGSKGELKPVVTTMIPKPSPNITNGSGGGKISDVVCNMMTLNMPPVTDDMDDNLSDDDKSLLVQALHGSGYSGYSHVYSNTINTDTN